MTERLQNAMVVIALAASCVGGYLIFGGQSRLSAFISGSLLTWACVFAATIKHEARHD